MVACHNTTAAAAQRTEHEFPIGTFYVWTDRFIEHGVRAFRSDQRDGSVERKTSETGVCPV